MISLINNMAEKQKNNETNMKNKYRSRVIKMQK